MKIVENGRHRSLPLNMPSKKTMRTVDEQFIKETSFWQKLRRDCQLLGRIGKMIFAYFKEGRRIRRLYRKKQLKGEIFWVDEEVKP